MAIFASANGQPLMCARLKGTQEDKCALIRKVGTAFAPDCFLLSLVYRETKDLEYYSQLEK